MTDFQSSKDVVRAHYSALATATPDTVAAILARHATPECTWRGMHPFNEQTGTDAIASAFWAPLLTAMPRLHRREDIFFAGLNEIDGFTSTWVASMGHLVGNLDAPFLGIPATGKMAFLRYAEFNRVEGGKIVETALFVDLLHLMEQAGVYPLPPQTGAHLIQPGPMTHDGLQRGAQDPSAGKTTLDLINFMIGDLQASRVENLSPAQELARSWRDDMIWWGPAGIGASYTIERYIEQHQRPFRTHLTDYEFNGHLCRMAEGNFGGFFGWPNLRMRNKGGYLGLPAGAPTEMRVVDFYRRDGDKLAENWIFIDMLHFLKLQGLDVLERLNTLR
jgi:hypothetical protein